MMHSFEISLEIYEIEKILQAIEDFSEVTNMTLQKNILQISWESDYEIQEIFREFMNYVLSL